MPDPTRPAYDPARLLADILSDLNNKLGDGLVLTEDKFDRAYRAAAVIMFCIGVQPEIQADDFSRAADSVRLLLLEERMDSPVRRTS